MSQRRFTEKPDLDPLAVRSLPDGHPALVENRTLFPSMVVDVTATTPDRLLVSGENNLKIGKTVEKGEFKGYAIYCLSLEERATCPSDCEVRGFCYGNGMQFGRRHRIGDPSAFFDRLDAEIAELAGQNVGVLIRLHVLGDFPSVEYVGFWKDILDEHDNVACFGYTHRRALAWGGDEIGDAIQSVKDEHPDRFRIRWSGKTARPDGATVLHIMPKQARGLDNEIVCPSQTDATACCATCALCWDKNAKRECIGFIKHGPKSNEVAALAAMAEAAAPPSPAKLDPSIVVDLKVSDEPPNPARRRIRPIQLPQSVRDGYAKTLMSPPPECRMVEPSTLVVEVGYQRDLSGKSLRLIKNIVAKWDWAKFKPPVCAETPDGLFVIDGQHTAIAAASHPKIEKIPVMVVHRPEIEDRASAFVAQNMDRVAMSPLQIFHAQLVAGDKDALGILRCAIKAGASVPRSPPAKGQAKLGEIVSVGALHQIYDPKEPEHLERVLRIIVLSGLTPINSLLIRGISLLLKTSEPYTSDLPLIREINDEEIAWHLAKSPIDDIDAIASDMQTNKYHALATVVENGVWEFSDDYAEHKKNAHAG